MKVYAQSPEEENNAKLLAEHLKVSFAGVKAQNMQTQAGHEEILSGGMSQANLVVGQEGLWLEGEDIRMRGDFQTLLPRIRKAALRAELLVKASGINKMPQNDSAPYAIDATAGMGEDSFLLAAAGFYVMMYEKDPVIAALLRNAMDRAMDDERLRDVISRMTLIEGDSVEAMKQMGTDRFSEERIPAWRAAAAPSVILLDPMFPQRTKSALVKKKFQLLHLLEHPCDDEEALLQAAIQANPGRILIKRPCKGPWLANIKPAFSLSGKAIRYDCLLPPY